MRATVPGAGSTPKRHDWETSGPATVRDMSAALGRGSVLADKYRLELLLGEGGMGFVWSAYHLELKLPVAIKLLRAGPRNERLAERLRLEARAAARLVHPSIVRVFDIGVAAGGDPFIVMELLSGESLGDVLCRGPLSAAAAVQILLPIADALALAHAKGIVHRDLKPDNVFLSNDGDQLQPKLLDFGIAKLDRGSAEFSKLTEKGIVLGSPSYMSPEQVRGDDVDHRSDIWSFCVVLYKAISGVAPFRGADKLAIMDAIMHDQPRPLPSRSAVDSTLAGLIREGLAKAPEHRPASIRELGRRLAQWLVEQGVTEDACGAPLAAKWQLRGQPISRGLALIEPPTEDTLDEQRLDRPQGERVGANPTTGTNGNLATERIARLSSRPPGYTLERVFPRRQLRWALLTAASMLIVGSSVAWTNAAQHASPAVPGSGLPLPVVAVSSSVVRATSSEPTFPFTDPPVAETHPRPAGAATSSLALGKPAPTAERRVKPKVSPKVSPSPARPPASRLPF